MLKIRTGGTAAVVLAGVSYAHAQEAVQWRVEDGGNGHWYSFVSGSVPCSSPVDAETIIAAAESLGGHLASFATEAEWDFVNQAYGDGREAGPPCESDWFFGLRSAPDSSVWQWVTGEPVEFTAWGSASCGAGPYPNNSPASTLAYASHRQDCGVVWDDGVVGSEGRHYMVEWSADCNNDGIVDYGQIFDGSLADCDSDGVPDYCEISETTAASEPGTPAGPTDFATFDVSSLPDALDSVTLDVSALGDLAGPARFLIVYLDEPTLENRIGIVFSSASESCVEQTERLAINAATWNAAGIDGSRSILIAGSGLGQICGEDAFTAIAVTVPIIFEDCNTNGIWDGCEIADGTLSDRDADGVSDGCDGCPNDPSKTEAGTCGCGTPDSGDADGDGILDCVDPCPAWPYDCSDDGQTIYVAAGQPIQAAVDAAPAGGIVELGVGTHTGGGAALIEVTGRPLIIRGQQAEAPATLDGEGSRRGIHCVDPAASGSVIQGIEIVNCTTADAGGGAYVANVSISFEDCAFLGNLAADGVEGGDGGGVAVFGAVVNFLSCSFDGNTASRRGGGLFAGSESSIVLEDVRFRSNIADQAGGGLCSEESDVSLATCEVFQNIAGESGGGVHIQNGTAAIQYCSFVENQSSKHAGGVAASGADIDISYCQFSGNASFYAGGAWFYLSSGVVSDTVFRRNMADWHGGGGVAQGAGMEFLRCQFSNNVASGGGGFGTAGQVRFDSCRFEGNIARVEPGGGLKCYESVVEINACEFLDNSARGGGGVAGTTLGGPGSIALADCLFQGNDAGGLGDAVLVPNGIDAEFSTTLVCQNGAPLVGISAGHDHSLALRAGGRVECWGSDLSGQCTPPDDLIDPDNHVIAVAAGSWHSSAILADGTIRCWGANDHGQCDVPAELMNGSRRVVQIAPGEQHTIALVEGGAIYAWGRNNIGQCNVPSAATNPDNPPLQVLSAGYNSFAILESGDLVGWGENIYGQLNVPPGIGSDGLRVVAAAGSFHTVALLEDGSVRAWGRNGGGQCDVPGDLGASGARVVGVEVSAFQSFALMDDGSVRCWGAATSPQGLTQPCPAPAELEYPGAFPLLVDMGAYHALAVDNTGALIAWGFNGAGQTTIPSGVESPSQILGAYDDLGGNCVSTACDSDGDGTLDCDDGCPDDPAKVDPGQCGCGVEDVDTDNDGMADCIDPCLNWPFDCSKDGQTLLVASGQSIQDALFVVPEGGVVEVAAGTFAIDDQNGLIKTGGDFTLRGSVDADGVPITILDAGGNGRLMTLGFGQTNATVIENLVLENGHRDGTAGAVGLNGNSSPTFRNCWFRNNSAGVAGGAVHVMDGLPRFESCRFDSNLATGDGGAIYGIRSTVVLFECLFGGNTSAVGGALAIEDSAGNMVDDCLFLDNIADRGGAVYLGNSHLEMNRSALVGNISPISGAAIEAELSTLDLSGSTICSNGPADALSGGIADLGGNCILAECGDDLDENDVPDACDPDCNGDGIPDSLETDCDGNGNPDECELSNGTAADCNMNGIPDSCDITAGVDPDTNFNGIPDSCELASGDLNLDGCIDAGDLGLLIALWALTDPPVGDLNGDGVIGAADLGLLIGNWTPCDP